MRGRGDLPLSADVNVTSLVDVDSTPMNVHTSVMRVPTPTGSSGNCWMLCSPAVDCHWGLFLASVTKANTSARGRRMTTLVVTVVAILRRILPIDGKRHLLIASVRCRSAVLVMCLGLRARPSFAWLEGSVPAAKTVRIVRCNGLFSVRARQEGVSSNRAPGFQVMLRSHPYGLAT